MLLIILSIIVFSIVIYRAATKEERERKSKELYDSYVKRKEELEEQIRINRTLMDIEKNKVARIKNEMEENRKQYYELINKENENKC